jgi:hypothetical protein
MILRSLAFVTFSTMCHHASVPVIQSKIATFTGAEEAQCVFWFQKTQSVTQVHRTFCTRYAKDPPSMLSIYDCHSHHIVDHTHKSGRPALSEEEGYSGSGEDVLLSTS